MSPETQTATMQVPVDSGNAAAEDKELVDRIIYLGTLVSQRDRIDPLMDTLRAATVSWHEGEPLAPASRQALQQLEVRLKRYLVDEDPLRAFTAEALDKRLASFKAGGILSDRHKRNLGMVIVLSVVAASLSFAIPYDLSLVTRLLVSAPLFFFALHVGIAWFYLTAMRNFNQEVRRAFTYICIGIVVLSFGFSHYVILQLFELGNYPMLKYGGVTWFLSVPFIFMFIGLHIYGKLLHVKSLVMSIPFVLVIVAVASAAVAFAPHATADNELYFDFFTVGAAMIPIFGLLSSVLARKIRDVATPVYARPMAWLYRYSLLVGGGAVTAIAVLLVFGELRGTALSVVTTVCGIPPQLLLLYTGYLFKKETSR